MAEFLQWVSDIDKLFGFIVFLVMTSAGIFAWLQKRGRSFVGEEVAPLRTGQKDQAERLSKVEKRLDAVNRNFSDLSVRTSNIEATLPSLATREDLTNLRVQMAELKATAMSMSNKVDTLYRAALAGNRRDET